MATDAENVQLVDLTDEELAAIDTRPAEARLVVYPFLDQLSQEERQTAVVVAFRGLAARGFVAGPDSEDLKKAAEQTNGSGTATVEIAMNEALKRLLELRATATRAVVAQRTISDQQDFCYLYLVEDGVLVEHVEPLGLHKFSIYAESETANVLAAYLNPTEVKGADGGTEMIDATQAAEGGAPKALVERLGAASSFGEFFLRHLDREEERPPLTGVFAGEGGLHMMSAHYLSLEPVAVTAISAKTLLRKVREALDA